MKLFLIPILAMLLGGCVSSEKLVEARDGGTSYREASSGTASDFVAAGDSVHQGPTKQKERQSLLRQWYIVTVIVFVAVLMALLIGRLE